MCMYSTQLTVNIDIQTACVAVTLAMHQRTVLCPHEAQAAIWSQGVAQHPLGCVRPAHQ